jgi:hypothetical protein
VIGTRLLLKRGSIRILRFVSGHRFSDAAHVTKFNRAFRRWFADQETDP